jgi:plastocyanin
MAGSFTVVSGTSGGVVLPHGVVRNIKVEDYEFKPSSLTVNLGDTIRWFLDDGSHTTTSTTIPSAAASWNAPVNSSNPVFIYVPTVAGTYSYKCVPHASMGMVGSFTVVGTATSVPANTSMQAIIIYPNPATSTLHINLMALSGPVRAIVLDATGQEVTRATLAGGTESTLPIAQLSQGIYFLQVIGENIKYVQGFSVAR